MNRSHSLDKYFIYRRLYCFSDICFNVSFIGTFKAEEWSDKQKQFHENRGLGIQITVEELPHNSRLVNQKGPSSGTFTFTAVESGDHAICFRTNSSSWFSSIQVRLHLDMAIGDAMNSDDIETNQITGKEVWEEKEARRRVVIGEIVGGLRSMKEQL